MHKPFLLALLILSTVTLSAQNHLTKSQITQKLEAAYDLDQDIRHRFGNSKFGSPEYKMLRDSLHYIDSINQSIVFPILDEYGWLNSKETSVKASQANYYVIQHADSAAQAKYLKQIETAYKSKEITNLDFARFADRLLFRQGKFQTYGLQTGGDPLGNSYLYPIKNLKKVNKARKKLGFNKLEEDLDSNTVYNLPGLSNLKDPVVFIAHFASDKNFTAPANDIEVICDGKIIGKSNEHGLVYIGLNKPPHQEIILTLQKGGKSRTYTLKGDKDFYEYWGAWIN